MVKKYKNMARKKSYTIPPPAVDAETNNDEISGREDTIKSLDDIAELQPSKKAQITAKKISEKYRKMRMKKPLEVITVPPNIVQQVIDSKISVK